MLQNEYTTTSPVASFNPFKFTNWKKCCFILRDVSYLDLPSTPCTHVPDGYCIATPMSRQQTSSWLSWLRTVVDNCVFYKFNTIDKRLIGCSKTNVIKSCRLRLYYKPDQNVQNLRSFWCQKEIVRWKQHHLNKRISQLHGTNP